ncbi:unnamed protein product [Paramecium pentaurelia]|uniref:Uncharacterized protein n=1 Tax=Paramecium pentaurelia TaxID=43138 RepID=A0A8S1VWY3_9CILI|nr:unnamed protein product [Paramecium pentaurelia]
MGKYDASRLIEQSVFPLIRISLFLNYFKKTYFGDEIFMLRVILNRIEPKASYIEIIKDFHMIPITGLLKGPTINAFLIGFLMIKIIFILNDYRNLYINYHYTIMALFAL